ncbi:MAG: flagellar protein export ATPase FliI [Proteobacteria bacterium]|nr:flagellar protein export ATPase FliI [Pseudomonadota bacterium]
MTVFGTNIAKEVDRLSDHKVFGKVTDVVGLLIEVGGVQGSLSVGDHCEIIARNDRRVTCEVVGFSNNRALLMPFGPVDGIGMGSRVEISASKPVIYPDESWLGRVINAFGEPVDGKGPLISGAVAYPIHNAPPPAHDRQRVGDKIDLGVRAMNVFLTCCKGQRMGIFAGSGIGKSTLLSMMARHTAAQVSVVGMIGERSREAREFIEDHLGPEGMAHSVVIVATSDESPLIRRQAAYVTMTVAEYFRDQKNDVLCLMDSVTRFAMAQREISLSAGEPPVSKGYTPTVFSELPKLLERAGPGTAEQGTISGLFTVLVEGDDHNEPVADAVRGILDGHVVLDRAIAERGRFPPINILRSISRTMPACNSAEENAAVNRARKLMAVYEDMAELIRLGAYQRGSDPQVDEALHYYPMLEDFLAQEIGEKTDLATCYRMLYEILGMDGGEAPEAAPPEAAAEAPPETPPPEPAPEPSPEPAPAAAPDRAADTAPDMSPQPEPGADEAMTEPADPVIMPAGPSFQTLPDSPPPEEDKGDEAADAEAGGEPPGESGKSPEPSPEEPPQKQD